MYYAIWICLAGQIIIPCIIFGVRYAFVKAKLNKLDKEDDAEAAKLRRHHQADLSDDFENKLTEIEDRKVARRKAENWKVRLLRTYSLFYFSTMWFWVVALYMSIYMEDVLDPYAFYVSIGVIVVCYVVVAGESATAAERKYIFNMDSSLSVAEYLQSMRASIPSTGMLAVAWHHETTSAYGSTRNMQSRTRRVCTGRFTEYFQYDSWMDTSKVDVEGMKKTGVTRIQMTLVVTPGDEVTAAALNEFRQVFYMKYRHRDTHVDIRPVHFVDGFKERVAAFSGVENKPWWINRFMYVTATLLFLSWPYRWIFNWATDEAHYTLHKVIYIRNLEGRRDRLPKLICMEGGTGDLEGFVSPLPTLEGQQSGW